MGETNIGRPITEKYYFSYSKIKFILYILFVVLLFIFIFISYFIYLYGCFPCMYVWVPLGCLVPLEVRRKCQIPWITSGCEFFPPWSSEGKMGHQQLHWSQPQKFCLGSSVLTRSWSVLTAIVNEKYILNMCHQGCLQSTKDRGLQTVGRSDFELTVQDHLPSVTDYASLCTKTNKERNK